MTEAAQMLGRVLVTGATGLVGRRLTASLRGDGVAVRAVSRSPQSAPADGTEDVTWVEWDGRNVPASELAGVDAVVHLSGKPIFGGLPTRSSLAAMRDSRVESTRALVAAIEGLGSDARPRTLICASAVGYYGSRGDELLDEDAAPGTGFLAELCRDWEAAAAYGSLRSVSLRLGIVLAREGGALPLMTLPFRLALGGRLGSGLQWVPWIHVDDAVGLIRHALASPSLAGPVNATAPQPVRNRELTATLARLLRRPARVPVPGFALRAVLGELADELLGSRRVAPTRALASGFEFSEPSLENALRRELG